MSPEQRAARQARWLTGRVSSVVAPLVIAMGLGAWTGARPSLEGPVPPTSHADTGGACRDDYTDINQVRGWHQIRLGALAGAPVETAANRDQLIAMADSFPGFVDDKIGKLREGMAAGYTVPRLVVQLVITQLDTLLALDTARSPIWGPGARSGDSAFRAAWSRAGHAAIEPSFRRFRDFLATVYLPVARQSIGLSALPGGVACYREAIRNWTSLDIPLDSITSIGEGELRRWTAAAAVISKARFDGQPVGVLLARFRSDTTMRFHSPDEMLSFARQTFDRTHGRLTPWFRRVPDRALLIAATPSYAAVGAPIGYYNPPNRPGEPGTFLVNTSRYATTSRFMDEAIIFHETDPGHNLQFGLAPDSNTAFISGYLEGWALYAEGVADEAGLYSSDTTRLGRVAKRLWATTRLIVEPGIHLHGWSRDRAVQYMRDHTTLSDDEIGVEVDRYISLPGQSLTYALGAVTIERLRAEAMRALGPRFDVRAFHEVVLADGVVSLPALERKVRAWIRGGGAVH